MSKTKELTSLGSGVRREAAKAKRPMPEWLEKFPDKSVNLHLVPFVQTRDEFTSVCPKTGQPDHARLEIIYVPQKWMVESKSLKEYLVSFRNHGEFHEDCIERIANDLNKLLMPFFLRVTGDFAPRGGLAICPSTIRCIGGWSNRKAMVHLIESWDKRKS